MYFIYNTLLIFYHRLFYNSKTQNLNVFIKHTSFTQCHRSAGTISMSDMNKALHQTYWTVQRTKHTNSISRQSIQLSRWTIFCFRTGCLPKLTSCAPGRKVYTSNSIHHSTLCMYTDILVGLYKVTRQTMSTVRACCIQSHPLCYPDNWTFWCSVREMLHLSKINVAMVTVTMQYSLEK